MEGDPGATNVVTGTLSVHLYAFIDEVDLEDCSLHVMEEFGSLLNLKTALVVEVRVSAELCG